MKITLRDANRQDSIKLSRMAIASKKHWNYPEEWIRLWADELEIKADFIDRNKVIIADHEDVTVGFAALSFTETFAELEHLWILPKYMKNGIGKLLFKSMIEYCKGKDVNEIRIISDPNALNFYQKLGAQQSGFVKSIPEPRKLPLLIFKV